MELRTQYRIIYDSSGYADELFPKLEDAIDRQKYRAKKRVLPGWAKYGYYAGDGSKIMREIIISELVPGTIVEGEKAEEV